MGLLGVRPRSSSALATSLLAHERVVVLGSLQHTPLVLREVRAAVVIGRRVPPEGGTGDHHHETEAETNS
jgi:hypothetical protein